MAAAREVLLAKIMAHVASSGLSDVSLRELADAVGSSHRMLIYHFGSREGLVAAIVEAMEEQQRQALQELAEDSSAPGDLVTRQWAQLSDPELRPFVRLFFEVLAQALHRRPGTEGFLDQLTEPWLDVATGISERLEVAIDRDELRLAVAVIRGLLLEALASGDAEPATASLHRFLRMWELSRTAR